MSISMAEGALMEVRDKLEQWEDMIVNCAGVPQNPDSLPQMLLHEIRELRRTLEP